MKRCTICLLPDTKPDLYFNEAGECAACINYRNRSSIDWDQRRKDLVSLLDRYRGERIIVPVSGGKDSTFQVVTMLEHGMRVLAVTATTDYPTELGRKNLDNLKRLGVDHIEVTANQKVRAKLMRIGLQSVGDLSWGEHASIFSTPVRVAIQEGIRLIVWGESSQNEYGQGKEIPMGRRWFGEFAGLGGLRPSDMVGRDGITEEDMLWYTYPSDEEIEKAGVSAIWLGSYVPWDSMHNAYVAQQHGFTVYDQQSTWNEGSHWIAENLDNGATGARDALKFAKFGFGRVCDQVSVDLRRGRIGRDRAKELVREYDGIPPKSFRGVTLEDLCSYIGIMQYQYVDVLKRYAKASGLFREAMHMSVYPEVLLDDRGRPMLKDWGF